MSYEDLRNKKNQLIRRAKDGSVFIARMNVPLMATLTAGPTASLLTLDPDDWMDLGHISTEGATYDRETETTETQSYGSRESTRTDVTRDEISLNVTAQETKLLTIGLSTGAELDAIKAAAVTGEVQIAKPFTPRLRFYRTFGLFLDHDDNGREIYFARLMPRAQISEFGSQGYNEDENGISYPMVWRGKEDSSVGYSHKWLWGGPGWLALLSDMGIPQNTA
ncbi:phage tail tube protein [Actinoplanes derwentensis]|uniref:Major tail protein n=1 Tax=Actinoplanes derwentensis TaxID=113562 RepID=A0A1H2CVT6_9ACTN|nr:hypothetical protein [Actinoplanes derwentensis]GID82017.1 hypothetical protein Ade03nite_09410 [Actinoplanes derwentensis]SDT74377.1 hypothetical protein SAMN04489716_6963 [Actinoplanes derwentensis]